MAASAVTAVMTASSHVPTYERMTGGCSNLLAAQMLSFSSHHLPISPITSSSYILDIACGPGVVSAEILTQHPDARILAADLNPEMITQVEQRIAKGGWKNVKTAVLDARDLSSIKDETFSHVFMSLGLPAPGDREESTAVAREVFRVLETGGAAMFSTWADRVFLSAFYATASTIRPHEAPQTSLAISPECLRGSFLVSLLEEAGFGSNVALKPCVTYSTASCLQELGENMMLAKSMFFAGYSEEELERAMPVLRKELSKLRTYEVFDGGVRIGMKAWIAVGWRRGDEKEMPV